MINITDDHGEVVLSSTYPGPQCVLVSSELYPEQCGRVVRVIAVAVNTFGKSNTTGVDVNVDCQGNNTAGGKILPLFIIHIKGIEMIRFSFVYIFMVVQIAPNGLT